MIRYTAAAIAYIAERIITRACRGMNYGTRGDRDVRSFLATIQFRSLSRGYVFVDDASLSCTGTLSRVARGLAAATQRTVAALQELKLEISPNKSIGVASRPKLLE